MPQPSALPGLESASQYTDRLFFAVFPDAATAARIARLAQQFREAYGLHGKPLTPERFHASLHYLGDHAGLPRGLVDAACNAAATVVASAFDVTFDRALSFSRARRGLPFVLCGSDGVAALKTLQHTLGRALEQTLTGHWRQSGFTPHVTLLYDRQTVPMQLVEPISWTVQEFVLVHSLLGRTLHVPLARWPLHA